MLLLFSTHAHNGSEACLLVLIKTLVESVLLLNILIPQDACLLVLIKTLVESVLLLKILIPQYACLLVLINTLVEAVLLFDIFSTTESERLSFPYFLLLKYISKDLNHPGLGSLFHFVVLSDLSSTFEF